MNEGAEVDLPMTKTILAAVMILANAAGTLAAHEVRLTSLKAIHALTNQQASTQIPVDFEATVTYYRDYERTLFVQDGETAIYVYADTRLQLMPGDRIRIRGTLTRVSVPM